MSRITDKNAGAKQQRNGQWSPRLSATAHPKRPVVGHLRFATRAKAISEAEVLSRKIIDGDLTLSELLGAKAPTPVQVTMAPTVDDIIRAFISERANNQTIKPTQHRSWRSLRKSRISASGGIGQLDATTITVPQAHNFLAGMLANGLSASRTKQAFSLIRLAFAHAVQTGTLPTNPLRDLDMPATRATPSRDYTAPTWAMVAALVKVMTKRRSILMVLVLMWAGLRYAELASLHIEDVDRDRPILHIRHSYARDPLKQDMISAERTKWIADRKAMTGPDGKPLSRSQRRRLKMPHRLRFPDVWTDGISKNSKVRDVPIPTPLWRDLLKWIDTLDAPADPRFPLLFASALSPYPQDNSGFHALWSEAITKFGDTVLAELAAQAQGSGDIADLEDVDGMNPHHLRGGAASFLSDGGMSLLDVRDHLGHSSIATTERFYAGGITDSGHEAERASLRSLPGMSIAERMDAMYEAFEAKYFYFGVYGDDENIAA